MSSALPPIDPTAIPAGVRAEGTKAVGLYESALSFESMLDQQLTQSLTTTLQGDGDSSDGSSPDAGTSITLQMLPQELANGLVSSGGLGIAPQIYQALGGKTATTSPEPTAMPTEPTTK